MCCKRSRPEIDRGVRAVFASGANDAIAFRAFTFDILSAVECGQVIKMALKSIAEARQRLELARTLTYGGMVAGENGFGSREAMAPACIELGVLAHQARRLMSLLRPAVCCQDVIGQVGEIEIGLIGQGLQHEQAFEHFHAQLVNEVQGQRGDRFGGVKFGIRFEHDAAMYY
ncbi:hypothetical protein UI24_16225 [Mycobacteroides franklinii]|nr:hypothetical protein [Mycobacteroides franklinii]